MLFVLPDNLGLLQYFATYRGDSQRTPSMLTAVTQVDAAGGSARQMRTFRQQSYYRSSSNGTAGGPFKEQVGLLQVGGAGGSGATPHMMRKSSSVRSPHPNHSSAIATRHSGCLREQEELLLQTKPSTLVLNYDSQRGGVGVGVANGNKLMTGASLRVDNKECVSSV